MLQWFPFAHWLWTQTTNSSHLTEFSAWKICIYVSWMKKDTSTVYKFLHMFSQISWGEFHSVPHTLVMTSKWFHSFYIFLYEACKCSPSPSPAGGVYSGLLGVVEWEALSGERERRSWQFGPRVLFIYFFNPKII